MRYRIRQLVEPSGKKIFWAEYKWFIFWIGVGYTSIWDDPIIRLSRGSAEGDICSDIHERYAKTITLAEYQVG